MPTALRSTAIRFSASLVVVFLAATAAAMADPAADCDSFAAAPHDISRPEGNPGVPWKELATQATAAIRACRAAVEANPGSVRLKYQLGRALDAHGESAEAAEWYERVADAYPAAMADLAGLYADGVGVSRDDAAALQMARAAADAGDSLGMVWLSILYRTGQGTVQDYAAARRWALRAADLGNTEAMTLLGDLYRDGLGVNADPKRAADWYRKAAAPRVATVEAAPEAEPPVDAFTAMLQQAEAGDAAAMNRVGNAYMDGRGVPKDEAQGIAWLRKAVDAGNGFAMMNLAVAYATGQGVEQDQAESLRLMRMAGERGVEPAYKPLAMTYFEGRGVPIDLVEAVKWTRKAAEAGDTEAMLRLGQAFRSGEGTAADPISARLWLQRAAREGEPQADFDLFFAFDSGGFGKADPARAADHLVRAIKGGLEVASAWVGSGLPGSTRETRIALQRLLATEGLYDGQLDGDIGPATKSAVARLAAQ